MGRHMVNRVDFYLSMKDPSYLVDTLFDENDIISFTSVITNVVYVGCTRDKSEKITLALESFQLF